MARTLVVEVRVGVDEALLLSFAIRVEITSMTVLARGRRIVMPTLRRDALLRLYVPTVSSPAVALATKF
jgi:hypothetical protein